MIHEFMGQSSYLVPLNTHRMIIHPVDDVWIRVECEDHEARELSDYFTFDVPGAQYMPQFRKRYWTGKIHLFKLRGHLLYRGLLPRLIEFGQQQGYTIENRLPEPASLVSRLKTISLETLPVKPRGYQVAALQELLTTHRGIVLSPTGSGKSLIIYLLLQALNVPTLIVVPTTGLVAQMHADFVSYGMDPGRIQSIRGGLSKEVEIPYKITFEDGRSFHLRGNENIETLNRGVVRVDSLIIGDDIDESKFPE